MFLSLTHFNGRHVSEYLTVQRKDPKAHKFLGQLFERDGETDKAVGCYKVWTFLVCSHMFFYCMVLNTLEFNVIVHKS